MTKSILSFALILITYGVGAQNTAEMRSINNNAPVKCSKSITINADRQQVWEVLTNVDAWSSWQTDISNPKLNGSLNPGATFDWKTGGAKIRSTLHTVNPYYQFGWTGKTFGMFAIHNWTLTELDGKTTVEVDESMEGLLTKLFRKSFNENLEKGMQSWLDMLKEECEN